MDGAQFQQELPRTHDAPWLARRALGNWYGALLPADELHRAKLLTSELVTNAVLHGRGRILLGAGLHRRRLLVEVADEGPGFAYAAGRRGIDRLPGQGLAIVEAESALWGIRQDTARVWFELEVSAAAGAAEAVAGRIRDIRGADPVQAVRSSLHS